MSAACSPEHSMGSEAQDSFPVRWVAGGDASATASCSSSAYAPSGTSAGGCAALQHIDPSYRPLRRSPATHVLLTCMFDGLVDHVIDCAVVGSASDVIDVIVVIVVIVVSARLS